MPECTRDFLDNRIYTVVWKPETPAQHALLIVPPLGEERIHCAHIMNRMMRAAAEQGILSCMFDHPGCGESSGTLDDLSLEASSSAGRALAERAAAGMELVILGIRSGALAAAHLAGAVNGRLLFWQPYLSGTRFLKDLQLQARIRGELTKGGSAAALLDGREVPEAVIDELQDLALDIEICPEALTGLVQISPGKRIQPQYKAAHQTGKVTVVQEGPFWNALAPGTGERTIQATLALLQGIKV